MADQVFPEQDRTFDEEVTGKSRCGIDAEAVQVVRRQFLQRVAPIVLSAGVLPWCSGCGEWWDNLWKEEEAIPPVRVPDDYSTIPMAIEAVQKIPFKQRPSILLQVGVHHLSEPLVVTQGVTIRGLVPDQTIIEAAKSVAFHFDSEERCRLEGVTIHSISSTPPVDNVPGYAPEAVLMVTKGTPSLYHCVIQSDMGNGLSLYGVGASVECDQCRLEGIGSKGIFISEHATGIFAEVVVLEAAYIGVLITTNANPLFNYCVIRNGRGNGVDVRTSARGSFHRCRIYSNGYSGVEISTRANPSFSSTEITNNGHWGINAFEGAMGLFTRCFILDNGRGEVSSDAGSQMSVNFERCITDRSQMDVKDKKELEKSEEEKKKAEEEDRAKKTKTDSKKGNA